MIKNLENKFVQTIDYKNVWEQSELNLYSEVMVLNILITLKVKLKRDIATELECIANLKMLLDGLYLN